MAPVDRVNRGQSPHELLLVCGGSLRKPAVEELRVRFDRGEGILEVVRRGLGDGLLNRFGAGTLGDIGEHPDRADDLPGVVGERTRGGQDGDDLAIEAAKSNLELLGRSETVAPEMLLHVRHIIGNDEVPQRRRRHARSG